MGGASKAKGSATHPEVGESGKPLPKIIEKVKKMKLKQTVHEMTGQIAGFLIFLSPLVAYAFYDRPDLFGYEWWQAGWLLVFGLGLLLIAANLSDTKVKNDSIAR